MLKEVSTFIAAHCLLSPTEKYLVALSGGADSVALLTVLCELGYHVEAVHCNFHLRGAESDRDEAFCQALCHQRQIPFHQVHFDTKAYAQLHRVSIEMAARELRYRYFEQLRKDIGAAGICVAHHRDDSVETILMNLVRGTGINGLTGIAPRNGYVLRPLLCVSREAIECFLNERGQTYVTDSTNRLDDVVRNKIRLKVLPLLRDINPAVQENIMRTARHLAEAQKVLDDATAKVLSETSVSNTICQQHLFQAPSMEFFLFQKLSPLGFTPAQIEQVSAWLELRKRGERVPSGKIWRSATHQLLLDRTGLVIEQQKDDPFKPLIIPEPGTYLCHGWGKIRVAEKEVDNSFSIPREKNYISLDSREISFPIKIRMTQSGDRFFPLGMNGSKLVSDYLTDIKKTLFEKQRQPVLLNGNGDILWVVGERPDHRYRITDDTVRVLIVEYIPENQSEPM